MAFYEYRCSECKNETTVSRGMAEEDPGYTCKTCNIPLNRVYSKVGVSFKGSGFYSTDK